MLRYPGRISVQANVYILCFSRGKNPESGSGLVTSSTNGLGKIHLTVYSYVRTARSLSVLWCRDGCLVHELSQTQDCSTTSKESDEDALDDATNGNLHLGRLWRRQNSSSSAEPCFHSLSSSLDSGAFATTVHTGFRVCDLHPTWQISDHSSSVCEEDEPHPILSARARSISCPFLSSRDRDASPLSYRVGSLEHASHTF
jgi:hypothetical protein